MLQFVSEKVGIVNLKAYSVFTTTYSNLIPQYMVHQKETTAKGCQYLSGSSKCKGGKNNRVLLIQEAQKLLGATLVHGIGLFLEWGREDQVPSSLQGRTYLRTL